MVLALFGGLLVGWVVRWLLGAASVLPTTAELTDWLTSQGVTAADLSVTGPQGRARLEGTVADGSRIRVHLSGRDTRGSGAARRLWALARLRSAVAGHVALTSRARVEQLSLACFLAERARVPSPVLVLLGEMPGETLVLVTTIPDGRPGAAGASLAGASVLVRVAPAPARRRRRAPRPAAGQPFHLGNRAGFCSLDAAEPGASELARRLDLVQALTTLARVVGPATAVAALRAGYGPVIGPPWRR